MKTVINLLEKFQEYTEEYGREPNLHDFGVWLQDTQRDNSLYAFDKRGIPIDPMIGYYLGNLMGFSEAWSKLALDSLPLKSLTDFGILKYVEQHKNPTKRMVAKHALAEETTIFEAIKRLVKSGLLIESSNPDDKRSKLVSLTLKGEEVTRSATEKVFNLSRLLVGDLSKEEKQSLLIILEKLQKFHEHMYHHTDREKISKNYSF